MQTAVYSRAALAVVALGLAGVAGVATLSAASPEKAEMSNNRNRLDTATSPYLKQHEEKELLRVRN